MKAEINQHQISEKIVYKKLTICTIETPFNFNSKTYIQKDGVLMASPLGSTFTDLYISHIEKQIMNKNNKFNPKTYLKYFGDTFVIFESINYLKLIITGYYKNIDIFICRPSKRIFYF